MSRLELLSSGARVAVAAFLFAALGARPGAAGEPPPGKAALGAFLESEVRAVSARSLSSVESREAWLAERERLRAELREMLGLSPEPPRGDLRGVVTGTLERPDLGIAVEKLHFQSVPGLYVTANLYRPLKVRGRLPAILYLCGHAQVKLDGVSYGNKASYQHHPAWFARNGYVCLIVDTLQLGEIEGKHHGTYRLGMWWWVSRGYTPAGVEAWNSIRAVDYLVSRPEVDPARIGVTGRSGGGIGTWWLAALDDRPAAFVPVAGITDLENHVLAGCIDGHCDCNYPVNIYRWDYPALAALAAPRPLLLANTDKDAIFPLDGVLRVHGKIKKVYDLLGARDRLGLSIADGPHADVQELQVAAFRWFERWLRGRANEPVSLPAEKLFDPKELRVFAEIPPDERNAAIEETFVPAAAAPPVPETREAFEALRRDLVSALEARTFRGRGDPGAPLEAERLEVSERGGLRLARHRFRSEGPFVLELWTLERAGGERPRSARLRVLGEEEWKGWADSIAAGGAPPEAPAAGEVLAAVAPRGIGPTRWASSAQEENGVRRRFLALGRTVEEARVLDVRRAVRLLASLEEAAGASISLDARGEMAALALYAAIFEPAVARLELEGLPASHREGPALLGVQRTLDIPQALAFLFPREVRLRGVPVERFPWTLAAARLFPDSSGAGPFRAAQAAPQRPNLVLVLTDDQGYGDVGLHGNPAIRTPNMDRLGSAGARIDPFYVSPVCSPTRASLLTGRYNYRTGVVDTYLGRARMFPDETTLAEILRGAGYRTGIFGKWHLGDTYPLRPADQGFEESLVHRGGGIGQPSDPPGGSSYFDPVLFRNGKPEKAAGYVTDVLAGEAIRFVERHAAEPFFLYLAFNCPHTPLEVPESYLAMYRDRDLSPSRFPAGGNRLPAWNDSLAETTARIYGMVTAIDDNLGRLLRKLDALGLSERTLVVFLSDNGPQQPRYVAGLRERKGSVHEGGIRVPCFWYWPGKIPPGRVVDSIGAHIDILPTALDALGVPLPGGLRTDGRSLWPEIAGGVGARPERLLFFQWHRGDEPELGRAFAVRGPRYKLVQPLGAAGPGTPTGPLRLYDLAGDPFEERDVAAAHPDVVEAMRRAYEAWFRDVRAERGFRAPPIVADPERESPVVLTRQDWRGTRATWDERGLGSWDVEFAGPGRLWDIALRFPPLRSAGRLRLRAGEREIARELEAGTAELAIEGIEIPRGRLSFEPELEDSSGTYGVYQAELYGRPPSPR